MIRLLSWNIARRESAWRALLTSDADVALLQEATEPPADVAKELGLDSSPWRTAGAGVDRPWRTAVVRLSDRVGVRWLEPFSIGDAEPGELAVSRPGTLSVAEVTPPGTRTPNLLIKSQRSAGPYRDPTDGVPRPNPSEKPMGATGLEPVTPCL